MGGKTRLGPEEPLVFEDMEEERVRVLYVIDTRKVLDRTVQDLPISGYLERLDTDFLVLIPLGRLIIYCFL
jgi:hypothetical protein